MLKLKRISCLVLVLFLFSMLFFPVAFPVHALVDPVTMLYPVWYAYGVQAGLTMSVSSSNATDFTMTSFPNLFDEWQSFEVSSGNQAMAYSISEFVANFTDLLNIGTAVTTGGVLTSVLRIKDTLVAKLARFWNWVMQEKLGASSYNSVNFASGEGNLVHTVKYFDEIKSVPFYFASRCRLTRLYVSPVYMFLAGNSTWVCCSAVRPSGNTLADYYNLNTNGSNVFNNYTYNSTYKLYYCTTSRNDFGTSQISQFATVGDGLSALYSQLMVGATPGNLTVGVQPGVDVLGFPDTDSPSYIPTDINIPWNVPYDQNKDLQDYLTSAFDSAMDNVLADVEQDQIEDGEVSPVDVVGPVTDYLSPGLADVFPFCIPFDLYNFLAALAAEPVAPSFTCTLAFPAALGGNQVITIDFDNETFNTLAQILRTMELLLFIVGLAYVTRSMIIRG